MREPNRNKVGNNGCNLAADGDSIGGVKGLLVASVSLLLRVRPGEETGDAKWELVRTGGRGGTWLLDFSTLSSSSLSEA